MWLPPEALAILFFWLTGKKSGEPAKEPVHKAQTDEAQKAAQRAAEAAKRGDTKKAAEEAERAALHAAAATQPAPWPQVLPKGLPAFPGGWEPDLPPPKAVVTRAWQLLPSLWKSGKPGATKTEQTAGRWITYKATLHPGKKRGVDAWRVKGMKG